MTGNERAVLVHERAYRILNDSRAAAAHAKYFEAQLRYRVTAARLRGFARVVASVLTALLSVDMGLGCVLADRA